MEPDKQWEIRPQLYDPRASAPERLTEADMIEVRVTLTPLRWTDLSHSYEEARERVGSQCHIARIEARDHRAIFHITRQMLHEMFLHYMGVNLEP